jgi:ABC-type microcin C transport system duplicated ATPase subunit YejF
MQAIRGNRIGMIFQEPMTSLNPVLRIGDQITEVLVQHRRMSQAQARAEAVRLLEKVRIPAARSRLDEYPMNFSGGMRQRVVIAIALACSPKLLIADEPTTALDVTIQAQILELIKTLQDEEGMSVLFITHDMGVVAEISDRRVIRSTSGRRRRSRIRRRRKSIRNPLHSTWTTGRSTPRRLLTRWRRTCNHSPLAGSSREYPSTIPIPPTILSRRSAPAIGASPSARAS